MEKQQRTITGVGVGGSASTDLCTCCLVSLTSRTLLRPWSPWGSLETAGIVNQRPRTPKTLSVSHISVRSEIRHSLVDPGCCSRKSRAQLARPLTADSMRSTILMPRYSQYKGLDMINTPSQILDSSLTGITQVIFVPPIGRSLQHVARSDTVFGQFHERLFLYQLALVVTQVGECKHRIRTGGRTLTRVRITITDSNTAFTGVASTMSLKAVRVSISAFSTAVVAERDPTSEYASPTAQASEVVMMWGSGRWGDGRRAVGGRIVGRWALNNEVDAERKSEQK